MTIEELQTKVEGLEKRIKELELPKTEIKPTVPFYDILRVNKLYASLPVYTVARTGTPQNGEIYLTDIGGTRKFCAFISGVEYSEIIT